MKKIRNIKRERQRKISKDMRKQIELKGIDEVVDNIIKDSEMNYTEKNRVWLESYVKRLAYG